jgi:cytochrome c
MKPLVAVIAAATAIAAGAALAQSGPDVLKAMGCLNCHDFDKKKVGPAYKDVAAKHKDDKNAEAMLVDKLKEGKGHPKIAATDAELKAAVGTVLSTK